MYSEDYKEQLLREHDGSKWGSTGDKYSGEWARGVLRERPYIQTVLDFGAGKGTLGASVQGVREWVDYDPGIPGIDTLPSRRFDMVISTDCLEHVEPEHLEAVLHKIGERADKVVALDIPCYPTGKLFMEGPHTGLDMHLIVESPTWWNETCDSYLKDFKLFSMEAIKRMSKGKYRERVRLIYERV